MQYVLCVIAIHGLQRVVLALLGVLLSAATVCVFYVCFQIEQSAQGVLASNNDVTHMSPEQPKPAQQHVTGKGRLSIT